ncbi:hypothetical protein JCM10213v2_006102 [Rhodosporidiobolus nylandii]
MVKIATAQKCRGRVVKRTAATRSSRAGVKLSTSTSPRPDKRQDEAPPAHLSELALSPKHATKNVWVALHARRKSRIVELSESEEDALLPASLPLPKPTTAKKRRSSEQGQTAHEATGRPAKSAERPRAAPHPDTKGAQLVKAKDLPQTGTKKAREGAASTTQKQQEKPPKPKAPKPADSKPTTPQTAKTRKRTTSRLEADGTRAKADQAVAVLGRPLPAKPTLPSLSKAFDGDEGRWQHGRADSGKEIRGLPRKQQEELLVMLHLAAEQLEDCRALQEAIELPARSKAAYYVRLPPQPEALDKGLEGEGSVDKVQETVTAKVLTPEECGAGETPAQPAAVARVVKEGAEAGQGAEDRQAEEERQATAGEARLDASGRAAPTLPVYAETPGDGDCLLRALAQKGVYVPCTTAALAASVYARTSHYEAGSMSGASGAGPDGEAFGVIDEGDEPEFEPSEEEKKALGLAPKHALVRERQAALVNVWSMPQLVEELTQPSTWLELPVLAPLAFVLDSSIFIYRVDPSGWAYDELDHCHTRSYHFPSDRLSLEEKDANGKRKPRRSKADTRLLWLGHLLLSLLYGILRKDGIVADGVLAAGVVSKTASGMGTAGQPLSTLDKFGAVPADLSNYEAAGFAIHHLTLTMRTRRRDFESASVARCLTPLSKYPHCPDINDPPPSPYLRLHRLYSLALAADHKGATFSTSSPGKLQSWRWLAKCANLEESNDVDTEWRKLSTVERNMITTGFGVQAKQVAVKRRKARAVPPGSKAKGGKMGGKWEGAKQQLKVKPFPASAQVKGSTLSSLTDNAQGLSSTTAVRLSEGYPELMICKQRERENPKIETFFSTLNAKGRCYAMYSEAVSPDMLTDKSPLHVSAVLSALGRKWGFYPNATNLFLAAKNIKTILGSKAGKAGIMETVVESLQALLPEDGKIRAKFPKLRIYKPATQKTTPVANPVLTLVRQACLDYCSREPPHGNDISLYASCEHSLFQTCASHLFGSVDRANAFVDLYSQVEVPFGGPTWERKYKAKQEWGEHSRCAQCFMALSWGADRGIWWDKRVEEVGLSDVQE